MVSPETTPPMSMEKPNVDTTSPNYQRGLLATKQTARNTGEIVVATTFYAQRAVFAAAGSKGD